MEAMIFLMIFGVCLLLTAFLLFLSKDPRQSPFLGRVQGLDDMTIEEAKRTARGSARIVAVVGVALIVICGFVVMILAR